MNRDRVVIGEVERAGRPLTAWVTNFEVSQPKDGALRFRDTGISFVMEQYREEKDGSGAWKEIPCYVKPS